LVPQDEVVSSNASNRVANRLIAAQPQPDRNRILERCETFELAGGAILCESDQPLAYAYFPLVGFISLGAMLRGRQPLEMGLIGNEGMLGATLALGVETVPMSAVVRGPGTALRVSAAQLKLELEHNPFLLRTLTRYLFVLITQMSHTAACTHFHEIEPRLARWLLMAHDRAHADRFHLTHGFLADILGVRRSGVTIAAGALQQRGLICYTRGDMQILDRRGLEAASCPCYDTLQADYRRLLP
jgi:CRP-like cAMP-binding protein